MCSTSATLTITDSAQVTAVLGGCNTYTGSISIADTFDGHLEFPDTLQDLTGSLSATNGYVLQSISANQLRTIGGAFSLGSLYSLSNLSFPNLVATNDLIWIYLGPYLSNLNFKTLNSVSNLTINGTFLASLDGINLNSAATMSILQNPLLTNITLPLTGSSNLVNVSGNAHGNCSLVLPNLQTVGSLAISDCSSVELSSLNTASGNVSFTYNAFPKLSLPLLTASDGLAIDSNSNLTTLTLPSYASNTNGLSVQNNTSLEGAISLPELQTVAGPATFIGTFSSVVLPKVVQISGAMTLDSTRNINSTCTHFKSLSGVSNVVQGGLTCEYPGTLLTYNGTTNNTNISSISTTHPRSNGPIIGGVVGGIAAIALIAALFILIIRSHSVKLRKLRIHELDADGTRRKTHLHEMADTQRRAELVADRTIDPVELEAPRPALEMPSNYVTLLTDESLVPRRKRLQFEVSKRVPRDSLHNQAQEVFTS